MLGDGGAFDLAAGLNFEGDIFRDVLRPMLKRIEGDNADRVVELPGHEIGNDAFEIGFGDIGLGECEAKVCPVIADDNIKILIGTVLHDRWSAAAAHRQLPTTRHREISARNGGSFLEKSEALVSEMCV